MCRGSCFPIYGKSRLQYTTSELQIVLLIVNSRNLHDWLIFFCGVGGGAVLDKHSVERDLRQEGKTQMPTEARLLTVHVVQGCSWSG